ncbi:TAP-like protein-domain-containing protein [Mycena alexandri]|uniref:TAP-like protein-domain-containing protein n=1 Tax=Mycena alexandri TaxID=1745969 RepID=A0AAD6S1G7_9AGAR|nr:TAP-like protein-domain-containing protein [Mycena alexandri]
MISPSLFLPCAIFLTPVLRALAQSQSFAWDRLTPSENLEWVPCYSTYQCTRLLVPLDYSDPSVGNAALAVIRFQANVSKADYGGPILFNPGGPSGSGVETLIPRGPEFHLVLGNQYDIVSWDPRGVSFSTPIASFFETDADISKPWAHYRGLLMERALWNAASFPTSLNASDDAIPHAWGRAHIEGQLAAQRDTTQIMKYMTTDNVARDMLRITQKLGFEKLQYYGVSYGSFLGAMFAAMFPASVVDANAWLNANLTIAATDTDAALQTFFDGCAAAGPDLCAFYKPTAPEIAERLASLTDAVRREPIPAITSQGYGLVDYSLLRMALAALENGNGTSLYLMLQDVPFQRDCANDTVPFTANGAEAAIAIQCGDAAPVKDSIGQFTEFYQNAAKTSQFVEFFVGQNRVSCTGWEVHRNDTFKGPVAAANTSFPLLLVTNTADPVTPKAGALKMAARFPGSGLLTQDSPGHTSNVAPSLCTAFYLRQYFQNGTLPEPGTVCSVDATLFGASSNLTSRMPSSTTEEEQVLEALKIIGAVVKPVIAGKFWRT